MLYAFYAITVSPFWLRALSIYFVRILRPQIFLVKKKDMTTKTMQIFPPEDNFFYVNAAFVFSSFFLFCQQTEKSIHCLHSFGFVFTWHLWNLFVSFVYINTVIKIQQCKNIHCLQFVWPHSFQIKLAFLYTHNWGLCSSYRSLLP